MAALGCIVGIIWIIELLAGILLGLTEGGWTKGLIFLIVVILAMVLFSTNGGALFVCEVIIAAIFWAIYDGKPRF